MNFTVTIERILNEEAAPVINSHQGAIDYIKDFLGKGNNFEDIDKNIAEKSYFPNKGHIYDHYEEILPIVQSWAKTKRTIQDAQNITAPFLMSNASMSTARALVDVFNSIEAIPNKTIEIWKNAKREENFIALIVDWCFDKNIHLRELVNDSRLSLLISQKVKIRIFLTIASKQPDKLKEMPSEWWEDIFEDIKKSRHTTSWVRESFCKLIANLTIPLNVLIQNFNEFISNGDLSIPRQMIKSLKGAATRQKNITNFSTTSYLDISYFKNKQVNEILNYISKTQVDALNKYKKIGYTVSRDIFSLYSNLKEQGLKETDIPLETRNLIKKMYEVGAINEFTDKPFDILSYDDGLIEDFEIKMIFRDVFSLVSCAIHFDYDIEDGKVSNYEVIRISDIYIHPLDSNDGLTEADLTPEELKHIKTYLYHAFEYYSDRYLNDYEVSED